MCLSPQALGRRLIVPRCVNGQLLEIAVIGLLSPPECRLRLLRQPMEISWHLSRVQKAAYHCPRSDYNLPSEVISRLVLRRAHCLVSQVCVTSNGKESARTMIYSHVVLSMIKTTCARVRQPSTADVHQRPPTAFDMTSHRSESKL